MAMQETAETSRSLNNKTSNCSCTRPFDAQIYEDEIDEDEVLDEEGRTRVKLEKEEERLRASVKRESQKRRVRERAHTKGLISGYLKGYDYDDEGVSLSAIKNTFKAGGKSDRPHIYLSDSDDGGYDSEKEDSGARKLKKAKKFISNEEEIEESQEIHQ